MIINDSVYVFPLQFVFRVNKLFAKRASCPHSGRNANLFEVAYERFGNASMVRQGDMAFGTAVVVAVVGATAAVGGSVVGVGAGITVVCGGRRIFGFVCSLTDGPVRIAIKAQSSVDSLLFHISGVVRGWNNLGATCE